jgi:branched-chain amino acid transport system substrate-binding protein
MKHRKTTTVWRILALLAAMALFAASCGDDLSSPTVDPLVDETPVDETPVDETPVDETPVDETPVDETPVDETPVDEGVAGCAGADGTTVLIGGNAAATGGAASIGGAWEQGMEVAVDVVNENGISVGGECYSFELVFEDNELSPERAIGANQRFLRDEISFVFGPGVSSIFTPAFESMAGTDVIVFSPSTTSAAIIGTPDGTLLFRTHIPDVGPAGRLAAMADAVVDRYSPATAAILTPQDAPGDIHTEGFTAGFASSGVDVVYSEHFDPETVDFAPFIAAIKAADPDMVVVGYLDKWVTPFLEQAVQADLTTPVFVGSPGATFAAAVDQPAIVNYAISVTTRAVDDADDPKTSVFRAAYEARYGAAPEAGTFWALSYFDAVQMLARAMEIAGTVDDPPAIATALLSPEATDYPGRTLDLTFTDIHDANYTPQMGYLESGVTAYADVAVG